MMNEVQLSTISFEFKLNKVLYLKIFSNFYWGHLKKKKPTLFFSPTISGLEYLKNHRIFKPKTGNRNSIGNSKNSV